MNDKCDLCKKPMRGYGRVLESSKANDVEMCSSCSNEARKLVVRTMQKKVITENMPRQDRTINMKKQ